MKKWVALLLVCFMTFSLTACSGGGNKGGTDPKADGSKSSIDETYNFATYSTGSAWYSYGATITDLLTKAGMKINMLAYGGGLADLLMVQNGEANLSLSFSTFSHWAENGLYAYEETGANPNLRLITGSFDQMYVTIALSPRLGVKSLEEIVERKMPINIYTSPSGSASDYSTELLLKALGVDYATIESWGGSVTHTDFASIADAYKDGKADLFAQHCSPGHATMTEITTTNEVIIPQLSDKVMDYLKGLGYNEMFIPANTFGTHDKVRCAGMVTTIVCDDSVPDDISYLIAKTLYENKEALKLGHSGFNDFDLEKCYLSEGNGGIPLAEGAKRYYKEKGLI